MAQTQTKIKQNKCPKVGGWLSKLWHVFSSVGYRSSGIKVGSGRPRAASRSHSGNCTKSCRPGTTFAKAPRKPSNQPELLEGRRLLKTALEQRKEASEIWKRRCTRFMSIFFRWSGTQNCRQGETPTRAAIFRTHLAVGKQKNPFLDTKSIFCKRSK